MNLDDRARQARTSLERHVVPDLDVVGARRSLDARSRRRHDERRRARAGVAVLSVLALVGGFAVVNSSGDDPGRRPDPDDELAIDDSDSEIISDEEFIEAMPHGPTDGKDSWRLPVGVSPQTGLNDGDTVRIYGRGFEPFDSLGVVHCSSEADTLNAGIGGCDLGTGGGYANVQYVSADANGDVAADVVVRRFITTPDFGQVDCASAAERCLLGMGAVSNYDRSGGAYIDFAGAPPFAQPTFAATPSADLTPGQQVQVDVAGWVPGRQIRIQQCVVGEGGLDGSERCEALLDTRADGVGSFSGTVSVNAAVIDDRGEVACGDACVLRANGIGVPEGTTAPLPDAVALAFVADAASLPTTSRPATTTTSPPPIDGNPAGRCEGYVGCTTGQPTALHDGTYLSVAQLADLLECHDLQYPEPTHDVPVEDSALCTSDVYFVPMGLETFASDADLQAALTAMDEMCLRVVVGERWLAYVGHEAQWAQVATVLGGTPVELDDCRPEGTPGG